MVKTPGSEAFYIRQVIFFQQAGKSFPGIEIDKRNEKIVKVGTALIYIEAGCLERLIHLLESYLLCQRAKYGYKRPAKPLGGIHQHVYDAAFFHHSGYFLQCPLRFIHVHQYTAE